MYKIKKDVDFVCRHPDVAHKKRGPKPKKVQPQVSLPNISCCAHLRLARRSCQNVTLVCV